MELTHMQPAQVFENFAQIINETYNPLLRYRVKEMEQLIVGGQKLTAFD